MKDSFEWIVAWCIALLPFIFAIIVNILFFAAIIFGAIWALDVFGILEVFKK